MDKFDKQLKQMCNRIKNYREIKGFSQDYMSLKLNISSSSYSRIERGEVQLTVPKLLQISELLGVRYNHIIEGEPSEPILPVSDSDNPKYELLNLLRDQVKLLKEQNDSYKARLGDLDKS
ncbi:MAG: helix-turn-helix transcriptional regulator [Bacteroidetes bacterium]|nr:helix-turn-helix transcriptional regulator [Bacteroidota bacterium]